MALDDPNKVDAIGIEKETGKIILTIVDAWEWHQPNSHLLALQAKLNSYFDFVEQGQLQSAYPAATDRDVVIEVVTRYPLHPDGDKLLCRAAESCRDLGIEIRTRHLQA